MVIEDCFKPVGAIFTTFRRFVAIVRRRHWRRRRLDDYWSLDGDFFALEYNYTLVKLDILGLLNNKRFNPKRDQKSQTSRHFRACSAMRSCSALASSISSLAITTGSSKIILYFISGVILQIVFFSQDYYKTR